MIPPKYKYYVGKAIAKGQLLDNTRIDVKTGEFHSGTTTLYKKFKSLDLMPVDNIKYIFINLAITSLANYNTVCFYDKDKNYLGFTSIVDSNPIEVISSAVYYAIQLYAGDILFKADTDFLYSAEPVEPHYKDVSKKYSKETNQEFFRTSLDGKITLFGKDYDAVKTSDLEDKLIFIITKYSNINYKWELYYKGTFNKTDCKFDYENRKCELNTSPLDDYTDILNGYENTYDLIKLAPPISKINLYKRSLIQVYIAGANTISNFFGGTYWESDVNEAINNDSDLKSKYYFAYIKSANEFHIQGASVEGVDGIYAGTDGRWENGKGFYIKSAATSAGQSTYIYIRRVDSDNIVYRSTKTYAFSDVNDISLSPDVTYSFTKLLGDGTAEFTLSNVFQYKIYQRMLCDVDYIDDSTATYDIPYDDFVSDNRNYKKCIGLTGGQFFCTSRTVTEPTKYGLNDYGEYFTNKFIPAIAGYGRIMPISRNTWANASFWYSYDATYELVEQKLRKKYVLKDSYSIADTINALLKQICPSIKHEATADYSRFLYDENTPISMVRFYLYITQKTNILKGDYDQAAQKAEITLKEVMEMLHDCFRCYWYVEDGKFKIEHISYFINGGSYDTSANIQLDLTKLKDQFNKVPLSYFQSEIEYDKSDLNSRYEFNWADDATELFGGVYIDIKSNYIQKDKNEEVNISKFSSDVDFMLFNPSNFSEDGFALLCPIINTDGELELPIVNANAIDDNGDEYTVIVQNWYASWLYLVQFYMYDMPAENIECNSVKNLYVQYIKMCVSNSIEIPLEADIDTMQLINTTLGTGKIDEVSINLNTGQAKIKLMYRPK